MTSTAIAARIRQVLCSLAHWLDSRSITGAPIGALVLFTVFNTHAQTTDLTGVSAAYAVETRDNDSPSGIQHLSLQIYRGNDWLYKQPSGQAFAEMWQLTTSGKLIYQRVYPDYKFKVVNNLLTNFHLPGSSLLFLVAALAGRGKILKAYNKAVKLGYRFYSYGDAMLIIC